MSKKSSIAFIGLSLALVLGATYLFQSTAAAQDKTATKKAGWEHKVIETSDDSRKLEQEIAKANEDGWELIGVVSSVRDSGIFSVRKGESTGFLSVKTTVKLIVKRAKQ